MPICHITVFCLKQSRINIQEKLLLSEAVLILVKLKYRIIVMNKYPKEIFV
jgi:hypothetical protein